MMWVCRAGKDSIYYNKFIENERIYLPWEGFHVDLSSKTCLSDYRVLVADEKGSHNTTTISNLACQLDYFCNQIMIGEYVLVPSRNSRTYALCRVIGNYKYSETDELPHSRQIEILRTDIQKDIFPQSIVYNLGTFRTIFRVKNEDKVLKIIEETSGALCK